MRKKKICVRLLIIIISIYVIFTLANQQKALNQYSQDSKDLVALIEEEKENKEELARQKDDITSSDFIEQTARDKLDMYYPNERVYIDIGM